ncbi:MAG: carboxypeptidase-like regulatory domain-containing protein [Pedobacter sp.]|nr:MAG: carboxypeptidase-like regulatory domain-containing protein [Pedobacter sp.]
MKKIYLSLIILLAFTNIALAQFQVTGKITESSGEVIPFASVYVKNTSKGVSANVDGVYKLTLDKGSYTLVFKAIGFKTVERNIELNSNLIANQALPTESYTLNNVVIRPNAEDPAYEIIRKTIKLRTQHLTEVDAFTTDVYTKGLQKLVSAPKKFLGRDIQKTLSLDSNRKGILYLSESQSTFSFKRPNKIHEEMVSSKVSGNNNAFSFNKASDLIVNFYENLMLENTGLSSRSFVSPIADNALFYYRYKLLGTSEENGVTINKIEVIPRRKNDPVFRGIIYIADNSWRLMGTNLYLTEDAGINFVDTLNISQQFVKVDKFYMPSSVRFQFNGGVLKFKFEGYFVGIYSNYQINPKFPEKFFTAEILKITKAVNKKDSLYWMNNRPIPLTEEEKLDYKKKDSIAMLKQSKPYLDSLERKNNKFGIGKLIFSGYSLNNRYEKKYITFDPLITSVFFNTVEGLALKYGVTYRKVLEDRKSYSIRPEVRYGFSNHLFTANISGNYNYNPLKRASISASAGTAVDDLNRYGSMSLRSNTINSLLFERNLSKFYKKEYANVGLSRELADGLQANLSAEFSKNSTLQNNSDYKFRDVKDEEYTSNNPFTPSLETPLFPNYNSFNVSATLTYTIGQTYITRPDGKFYQESKYPRFQLNYRKGFKGVLNSDVDYDYLGVEIYQERISTGLFGYFSFVVGAGKFLNNNAVYYPDSKHFRGNNSTIFPPNLRKFRFLDFYQYSTDQQFAEAHIEHNFGGLLINKIPLLRKLKLEEIIGASYLTQPNKKNYKEFYFGVERFGFGVSYGYSYDGNKKVDQGFRIAYGF